MNRIPTRLACIMLLTAFCAVGFLLSAPAGLVRARSNAAVQIQEDTAYPGQPTDGPYIPPAEGTTPPPTASLTPGGPSPTPGGPTSTLPGFTTPTSNPLTPSPTIGRNLFGTEDSEIGGARVTPPPSETPQPSLTPTPTVTRTPTPGLIKGFTLNRGLFVAGFLVPLGLLLFGWLGYRLLRTGEFSAKKPD